MSPTQPPPPPASSTTPAQEPPPLQLPTPHTPSFKPAEPTAAAATADNDEEDPTSILASLESEISSWNYLPPASQRESRAQAHATTLRHQRQYAQPNQPPPQSQIQILENDAALLAFTTQTAGATASCLVHFSHPDFARCAVMDTHLCRLVVRHGQGTDAGVRFGKVDVRAAPFVVEKLAVRVLPCLVGFLDGVAVGRVVGFEGVGRGAQAEDAVEVTRGIEAVVVGWRVFAARTKGWSVLGGGESGSSGDNEEEEERTKGRKTNGGLFGRRAIQGRKKRVGGDDDDDDDGDDWD